MDDNKTPLNQFNEQTNSQNKQIDKHIDSTEQGVVIRQNGNESTDSKTVFRQENSDETAEQVRQIPIFSKEETVYTSPNATTKKTKSKGGWTFKKVFVLVLVGAIALGGSAGAGYKLAANWGGATSAQGAYYIESRPAATLTSGEDNALSIPKIVEKLGPNIVSITSKKKMNDFFFREYEAEGAGTGVVFNINKDNVLIITNNHVIENADSLAVAFTDDDIADVEVVGTDPSADIAVLKVDKKDLSESVLNTLNGVVLGDSDNIKVGDLAIAIGNPLGYSDTVTVGFISGLGREIEASGRSYTLIQTDAAINPGNSGGALVNAKGEVVGINSVKISDTKVEGIGFAIPINSVKPIISDLLEKGYVSKPYLGITGDNVTKAAAEMYNIPVGVIVTGILEDSGADMADLKKSDIIVGLDGEKIKTMAELIRALSTRKVGQEVTLDIYRSGEKIKIPVTLQEKGKPE